MEGLLKERVDDRVLMKHSSVNLLQNSLIRTELRCFYEKTFLICQILQRMRSKALQDPTNMSHLNQIHSIL